MNVTKDRVLVVEDDVLSHRALARMLSRIGYEVLAATTVRDAMARLDAAQGAAALPQCMIIDLMLPDGSGVALLAEVRRRQLPVHVAVMSAANDARLLDAARAHAPDAMFSKPLHVPELMAWLRAAVKQPWSQAAQSLRRTG